MCWSVMLCALHHCCKIWLINSGPLSTRIREGVCLSWINRSNTLSTLNDGNEVSTSTASDSRLKSSRTFNSRNFLPSVKESLIKSILQVWFGPCGITNGCFTRSGRRFLALRLILSFICLYTRRTLLWFQVSPRLRSLWKLCQNPMEGCLSITLVNASCNALSSLGLFWYW